MQLGLLVPQELLAKTHTFPLDVPTTVFMEVVPCPAIITHPEGTVQLYVVAPDTAPTE